MAGLPQGTRITDHLSLGVIAKTFPRAQVKEVLQQWGRAGQRERDLPGHGVVYDVIALALFMQVSCREVWRCLLEGLAYPQLRLVARLETGTHVLFGALVGSYATGEITLAREVLGFLQAGRLCLADRVIAAESNAR